MFVYVYVTYMYTYICLCVCENTVLCAFCSVCWVCEYGKEDSKWNRIRTYIENRLGGVVVSYIAMLAEVQVIFNI